MIVPDRLLRDLDELAAIGGRSDGGVERLAGSPTDFEARLWLQRRLTEIGFEAWADETNNVFGHKAGSQPLWLLVGSHTDTVSAAGRLDGAYGVIAALESARALVEAGHPAAGRVEVVSFHDEEGAIGSGGTVGSRALCRHEHIRDIRGYLEIHIEQGPVLEMGGDDAAVVDAIVGIRRFEATIIGEPQHAGTTPYGARRDAAVPAAHLVLNLPSLLRQVAPDMVGNVGAITLHPGTPNVIPGRAEIAVEIRSKSTASIELATQHLQVELERWSKDQGCAVELVKKVDISPIGFDSQVIAALARVCDSRGKPWRVMSGGAIHDAGIMAAHVPTGLLFVPSARGITHSPREHTDERLLVQGAELVLNSIIELLG